MDGARIVARGAHGRGGFGEARPLLRVGSLARAVRGREVREESREQGGAAAAQLVQERTQLFGQDSEPVHAGLDLEMEAHRDPGGAARVLEEPELVRAEESEK